MLKPTFFPSVPRLYNKIYGTIQDKFNAADGLKAKLIKKAVETKLENLRSGKGFTHFLYDKLVFAKTKAILGGNVRIMVTGSAPIFKDVMDFMKICFCSEMSEGYGMTESGGASTV